MKFIPVDSSDKHCRFLFQALKDRPEECFISHHKMPSYDRHVEFVKNNPYKKWFIIKNKGVWVGNIYLTNLNEIGIFILTEFQEKGIGTLAVEKLLNESGPGRYLANISPENSTSESLFVNRFGFRHVQNTYALIKKGGTIKAKLPKKTHYDGGSYKKYS